MNNLDCKCVKSLIFISVVATLRRFDLTQTNKEKVRFQVFTPMTKKIALPWDTTPCKLVHERRHFGRNMLIPPSNLKI
jgi:hypothetical protein